MGKNKVYVFVFLLLILTAIGASAISKYRQRNKDLTRVYTNEKVTVSEGVASDGFPLDITYPGMTLDKSFKKEQGNKTDYVAVWLYDGGKEKAPEIMKWYIDELRKAGWGVEGPFVDESEKELSISAENNMYRLRLMNSERYPGDEAGAIGDIIVVDILQK